MFRLVLYFIITSLVIKSGESIKCYLCSSSSDENCADPINKNELEAQDCSSSGIGDIYDQVRKGLKGLTNFLGTEMKDMDISFACQKIDASDDEGNKVTLRSCTMAKTEGMDPCSVTSQVDKMLNGKMKVDFCDVCDGDYCNGGSKQSFSLLFYTLVPFLTVVYYSWFNV